MMIWIQGDLNGDEVVDVGDLGILAANYGVGANGANWEVDYDKAFGMTVVDDTEKDLVTSGLICDFFGLLLIAGLVLMGLILIKLDE